MMHSHVARSRDADAKRKKERRGEEEKREMGNGKDLGRGCR